VRFISLSQSNETWVANKSHLAVHFFHSAIVFFSGHFETTSPQWSRKQNQRIRPQRVSRKRMATPRILESPSRKHAQCFDAECRTVQNISVKSTVGDTVLMKDTALASTLTSFPYAEPKIVEWYTANNTTMLTFEPVRCVMKAVERTVQQVHSIRAWIRPTVDHTGLSWKFAKKWLIKKRKKKVVTVKRRHPVGGRVAQSVSKIMTGTIICQTIGEKNSSTENRRTRSLPYGTDCFLLRLGRQHSNSFETRYNGLVTPTSRENEVWVESSDQRSLFLYLLRAFADSF
jgi:hypothetical protein